MLFSIFWLETADTRAGSNVRNFWPCLAVDKLSQELKIRWKDNTRAAKLEMPSLVDFSLWLKGQADLYDDWYPKVSGRFSPQPGKNKARFGGSNGVTERQNAFSSNFTSRPKPKKIPLELWEMEKDTSYLLVPSLRP